jgi:hypothetical protein
MSYEKAVARIKQWWGLKTSGAALSQFFHRHCEPPKAGPPPSLAGSPIILDLTICVRLPGEAAAANYIARITLPAPFAKERRP